MLKTIRKNLTKKNSDSLKKLLLFGILSGGLISQNSVAFAAEDENIDNPYAYNTIETDDTRINFNGATEEYDGNYSMTVENGEGAGDFYYNRLTINGGNFKFIVNGGNYSGSFLNNQIYLNGGSFYSYIDEVDLYNGKISNNIFSINGGTFANEYTELWNVTAENNTVNISGTPDISGAYIYGGIFGDVENYYYEDIEKSEFENSEVKSNYNNVLNFNSSGLKARNIYDFDTINFNIPSSVTNGATLLTLTEGETDLSNTAVNANISGNTSLNPGDKINLISNENHLIYGGEGSVNITEGVTLDYGNSAITSDEKNLILTLGTPTVNEKTRAFSQGVLNTSITLSRGTDRIIDWLPPEELEEAVADGESISETVSNNWGIFASFEGAKLKTKTGAGSYVDSKGGGIDLGFARALEDSHGGNFIFAPLFDYGKTRFDSYLADGTHGSGHSRYFAGGVIGRKTWKNGVYLEGSFRGGSAKTDFSSDNLLSSYSASTPVFSGHIRAGRLLRIDKNNLLHYYGIYSHNHVNGFGADLSTGEHYDFDSVDSGKFKIGYRLTTRVSNLSKLYTGLAYQYEFNGSTSANYKGYKTTEAKVKGSSGMLELGWQLHANKESAWLVDFNVTGWIGVQKGVTAAAQVKKSF